MKILLVCAAGMSTGVLMKKMETYWAEQGVDLSINAVGVSECGDASAGYDIVMVGPQMSYRIQEVKDMTGLPCEAIPPTDYALHNCANIMKIAERLYEQKNS